jgi:hypothetical protein
LAAKKLFWCEKSKVLHDHPLNEARGPVDPKAVAEKDLVYKIGWDPERRREDQELLEKRRAAGWSL